MQATLLDTNGDDAGEIDLPEIFSTPYRPDLIARAVATAQANRTQPYGSDPMAGKRTSGESIGAGRGRARIPRANNRAVRVPQAVGGRRAHPPKTSADRGKDMNDKERQLATRSAIAATSDPDVVVERGHAFEDELALPIVIDDEFGDVNRTREVLDILEAIGVDEDVARAEDGRTIRAGRGTTRGRKYKQPKSILFVTSSDAGPSRGARNLAGADVTTAEEVNVEDLAPGGHAGRLTIWTEAAITEVADR